jgi:poly(beta-D-mannuronate) lyase
MIHFKRNKGIVLMAIVAICSANAYATNYTESIKNNLINRMVAALPGDTINIANGTYNWDLVSFVNNNGSATLAPIVLKAQSPGGVIFNGTTKFAFQITNMVFTGFVFKNGSGGVSSVIKVGKGSTLPSYYCRITNNVIDNYNSDTALLQKNAWIELDGDHHRVDHNTFVNKSNATATIIVIYTPVTYPNKAISTYNRIDSNYFKGRSYMGANEGETIRVGDAASARTDGYNIVEYNLVEDVTTASELEIFSNKSHRNTYRYNTIKNSNGGICLRFGRYCDVYGNFILNDNPARQVAGIRIIDKGHKVFNNYIEGVNGASLSSDQKRASICIYNGNFSDSALGSGEYFAADSSTIAFNTIVNAESGAAVVLGCVHGGTIQPKGLKLSNNLVKMSAGNGIYMNAANTSLTQSSEGNIYDASSLGITSTGWQSNTLNFGTRMNGVLTAPSLVQDAAINTTNYVSLLNAADGQGQIRSATYDVGFDELNATGTVIIQPLLPTQVGATFYLSSLPVHLVDFSLQKITNGVKIFWNVIDEVNMKHYELEFSNDASSFTRIATIIAKGKAIASYNYLHNGAVPNKVYYRIKMVNADGSFVYSPVRSISNKEEVSIKLYPNPANSFLVIESNISIKANARIINSFGAVVASINNIDFSSANKVSINVSQFKAGLYYLEYATANGNQAYPFIIANKK